MPQLRVFVSSTAYDLSMVRGQLKTFIHSLGHQAVMSEYSGVLYDPTSHTHESCVQELATCDAVVLIVGSRWGSQARPEFLSGLDPDSIADEGGNLEQLLASGHVSVTQLEALTAFKLGIPVFVFVEQNVRSEARLYEANSDLADEGKIVFPVVGDARTAKYIFKFLDYVAARPTGNAVMDFAQIEDIQGHLRLQWSALLQRMLHAARDASREQGLVETLTERLDDMKAAIVASIDSPDARNVAAGVLSFRLLCDLLSVLEAPDELIGSKDPVPFELLLSESGVLRVLTVGHEGEPARAAMSPRTLLVFETRALELRMSDRRFWAMPAEWADFCALSVDERRLILETLRRDRKSMGAITRTISLTPGMRNYLLDRPAVSRDELNSMMGEDRVHARRGSLSWGEIA